MTRTRSAQGLSVMFREDGTLAIVVVTVDNTPHSESLNSPRTTSERDRPSAISTHATVSKIAVGALHMYTFPLPDLDFFDEMKEGLGLGAHEGFPVRFERTELSSSLTSTSLRTPYLEGSSPKEEDSLNLLPDENYMFDLSTIIRSQVALSRMRLRRFTGGTADELAKTCRDNEKACSTDDIRSTGIPSTSTTRLQEIEGSQRHALANPGKHNETSCHR
ncbi:hypothetical protein SCHPADRAFT_886306 [Schizopora paradoxa]|uniref:Uncharacterized protein n=1 Tax=Schizopora paradoxa TaxID=27342 RepID=A0A0H2S299_9AGAM|nr:hypothetical protein SCHPADRAFT_886306 [Schizopora paradoxa]